MSLAAAWIQETEVVTEAGSKPVLTAKEIFQKSQPWQYAVQSGGRQWKHREEEMWRLARKLASFSRSGDCKSDIFPSVRRVAEELGWPESKVYRVYAWLVAAGIASHGGQNASGCRYRELHPENLRQAPLVREDGRHRNPHEDGSRETAKIGDIADALFGREDGSLNRREDGRLVRKRTSVRELQNQIQIQKQINAAKTAALLSLEELLWQEALNEQQRNRDLPPEERNALRAIFGEGSNYDPRPVNPQLLQECVSEFEGCIGAEMESTTGWLFYDDGSSEAYVQGEYDPIWHCPAA